MNSLHPNLSESGFAASGLERGIHSTSSRERLTASPLSHRLPGRIERRSGLKSALLFSRGLSGLLRFLCCVCLGLLGSPSRAADPLDEWSWRNPTPMGNALNRVAFGAGQFVAVGGPGLVFTSLDGAAWTQQRTPTTNGLSGLAYGAQLHVAVG